MREIRTELRRIEREFPAPGATHFLTERSHRVDREWWVLGKAVSILEIVGEVYPTHAVPTDPPNPDFMTFQAAGAPFHPIEITEVLRPGRKRTQEYRDPYHGYGMSIVEPHPTPWISFQRKLREKYLKQYGRDCWLIVYHNMGYSDISHVGEWHRTLVYEANKWASDPAVPWNPSRSPYGRILIMDAKASAMVELFPTIRVIRPEQHTPYP